MKKIFKSKRWIAFFLALLLIVTTCINSSDVFLWATGEDETSVSEQTDSGPAEDIVEMEVEEAEEETDSSETTEEADTEETGTDEAVAEETDGGERIRHRMRSRKPARMKGRFLRKLKFRKMELQKMKLRKKFRKLLKKQLHMAMPFIITMTV